MKPIPMFYCKSRESWELCPSYWMFRFDINYYRRISTMQEIRRWYTDSKFVRGKRSPANIPTSWSDIIRSRYSSKSWKDLYKVEKQWQKPRP